MTQTLEQMVARVERLELEVADLRATLANERSIERVGMAIEQMRRGESVDARDALLGLRKRLYPDAPPYSPQAVDVARQ